MKVALKIPVEKIRELIGDHQITCGNCHESLPPSRFDRKALTWIMLSPTKRPWCMFCKRTHLDRALANTRRRIEKAVEWNQRADKQQAKLKRLEKKLSRKRGRSNAKTSFNRPAAVNATPVWVNKQAIANIYVECQRKNIALNAKKHFVVDHIVPLKGKNVCGLHVPWNLQIITFSENARKSNKYEAAA